MNFLAHLYLAGDDDGLRLGALLGDFVRGKHALAGFTAEVHRGILLHRHIDRYIDVMPETTALRESLSPPFRRYGGIIIDLGYDHQLAKNWMQYSSVSLQSFDREIRDLLARYPDIVPQSLWRFMDYADRRGLFASYREAPEILHSLRGIGTRLSRPNPLHRVDEIWAVLEPRLACFFKQAFPQIQLEVAEWLKSKSTITGS
ncbi:MAG: ACP phosphodiesterase [Xanthomonadales bacterium]|nr:ACP phosphodiesterase [Xanthomonadales bacterium]